MSADEVGTVYLLCYDGYISPRTGHVQPLHYYGWAKHGDGQARIRQHMRGVSGARLPAAMHARGVRCYVGRIWRNATRADERALKRGRNAARRCLRCRKQRRALAQDAQLEWLLAKSVRREAARRGRVLPRAAHGER